MKAKNGIVAALLSAALLLTTTACAGSAASSAAGSAAGSTAAGGTGDTIGMSTNAEFEPFEYKQGGKIVGLDVDIANEIAKKANKKLAIRDVQFDALIAELESGKCDFVAAGMSVTPDRQKNVDFSDSYFDASQAIIVRKDSPVQSRKDLNGKNVGVQQGTTGDDYCTNSDHKNDVQVKNVKRYNKGSDAISDLISGRLDAVVIDDYPARKFVSKNADKIKRLKDALTVEHYAIAVKKGNTSMLNTINSVLKEMKSSGELDKLVAKYQSSLEGSD